MNILRTDREVAFNELFVATKRVADNYRCAAAMLDDTEFHSKFLQMAQEHDNIAHEIELLIRSLGDLPSTPDADKVDIEKLVHRIRAAISADEVKEILQQRFAAEQDLERVAIATQRIELNKEEKEIIDQAVINVDRAKCQLAESIKKS